MNDHNAHISAYVEAGIAHMESDQDAHVAAYVEYSPEFDNLECVDQDAHIDAYFWHIRVQEDLEQEENNSYLDDCAKYYRNWPFNN